MNLATYYQDGPRVGVADGGMMWDLRRVMALWLFEIERNVRAQSIAAVLERGRPVGVPGIGLQQVHADADSPTGFGIRARSRPAAVLE